MAKNAEIRDESMFNERIVTRKNYQVKAGKNKRFELLGKANSGGSISGQEVLYIHHNNASHSAPRISFIPPKSVPEVVMHFSSIRNPSDHSANYSVNKLSQISTVVTGLQGAGTVRTNISSRSKLSDSSVCLHPLPVRTAKVGGQGTAEPPGLGDLGRTALDDSIICRS